MTFASRNAQRATAAVASENQPKTRLIMACVLLIVAAGLVLRWMWNVFPPDLSAVFMASYVHGAGLSELMFDAPPGFFNDVPPSWVPLLPAIGLEGQPVLPYVYPPIWAILLSPLVHALGPFAFFNMMAVIEMAALLASIALSWRMARVFAVPAWAWGLITLGLVATSVISFGAIMHLQPQIIVVFLCLLAFERYATGHVATAGAILALAATLKIAPAALALIFLLDRNWRALGVFTAVCAGIAALSLHIGGLQLHADFFGSVRAAGAKPFVTAMTYSAEVLIYNLAMMLHLAPPVEPGARDFLLETDSLLVPVLSKTLLLLFLGWAIWATARLDTARRLVARVFLFSLLANLFGPLGWMHYYLPQLLLLPALIGLLPLRAGALTLGTIAFLTSGPFFLKLQGYFDGDLGVTSFGAATMILLFLLVTANLKRDHQGTA